MPRDLKYIHKTAVLLHLDKWERDLARSQGWQHADLWREGLNKRLESAELRSDILTKVSQRERQAVEHHQQNIVKIERQILELRITEEAARINKAKTKVREEWDEDEGKMIQIVEAI
jgi:hypothetical protein